MLLAASFDILVVSGGVQPETAIHEERELREENPIHALIKLLEDGKQEPRPIVAAILGTLALRSQNVGYIRDEGTIGPLVKLLRDGRPEAQVSAAAILGFLGQSSQNLDAIREEGGIKALVKLLCQSKPDSESMQIVGSTLGMLATNSQNRDVIREEGAIHPLVTLLRDGKQGAQLSAAVAISNLARNDRNQDVIREEGGIPHIIKLLQREGNLSTSMFTSQVSWNLGSKGSTAQEISPQELAASLLATLVANNTRNRDVLRQKGGIPHLIKVLQHGSQMGQESAARAVMALAEPRESQERHRKKPKKAKNKDKKQKKKPTPLRMQMNQSSDTIREDGGIPALIKLLQLDELPDTQLSATAALAYLAHGGDQNQDIIREQGGIPQMLRLVRDGRPESQRFATIAMALLAQDSAQNQDTIRKEGGIQALVKAVKEGGHEACGHAAAALASLASNDEISGVVHDEIHQAGGIRALVKALKEGTQDAQANAAAALGNLALHSVSEDVIRKEGGVLPLVVVLRSGSPEAQARAAAALQILAGNSQVNDVFREEGGIEPVLNILNIRPPFVPEAASAGSMSKAVGSDQADSARRAEVEAEIARQSAELGRSTAKQWVVVDGTNIGGGSAELDRKADAIASPNSEPLSASVLQLSAAVKAIEKKGMAPLVLLPEKFLALNKEDGGASPDDKKALSDLEQRGVLEMLRPTLAQDPDTVRAVIRRALTIDAELGTAGDAFVLSGGDFKSYVRREETQGIESEASTSESEMDDRVAGALERAGRGASKAKLAKPKKQQPNDLPKPMKPSQAQVDGIVSQRWVDSKCYHCLFDGEDCILRAPGEAFRQDPVAVEKGAAKEAAAEGPSMERSEPTAASTAPDTVAVTDEDVKLARGDDIADTSAKATQSEDKAIPQVPGSGLELKITGSDTAAEVSASGTGKAGEVATLASATAGAAALGRRSMKTAIANAMLGAGSQGAKAKDAAVTVPSLSLEATATPAATGAKALAEAQPQVSAAHVGEATHNIAAQQRTQASATEVAGEAIIADALAALEMQLIGQTSEAPLKQEMFIPAATKAGASAEVKEAKASAARATSPSRATAAAAAAAAEAETERATAAEAARFAAAKAKEAAAGERVNTAFLESVQEPPFALKGKASFAAVVARPSRSSFERGGVAAAQMPAMPFKTPAHLAQRFHTTRVTVPAVVLVAILVSAYAVFHVRRSREGTGDSPSTARREPLLGACA